MPVDACTHQPDGVLHGGASAVPAETVASTAAVLTPDIDQELAVGIDINATDLRAAQRHGGRLTQRPDG